MQSASGYDSETYYRMAQAIAFMRQHHLSQPDLATVAHHVGLSDYHFQRLFTQWAGISPKRFLQYLTIEYAKLKIAQTKSLLDLSLDLGLSSPGRLHDLFVNLEAMSPGEFKAGGANLQIRYGIHDTPFGKALIATTARGICNLYFLETQFSDAPSLAAPSLAAPSLAAPSLAAPSLAAPSLAAPSWDRTSEQAAEQVLRQSWSSAEIIHAPQTTQPLQELLFDSARFSDQKPLTVLVKGTNFQIQVWRALLKVPFGAITTYQSVAEMIGRPTATRAVGNAIGNNPIGYLIPCHRVIRESGQLGGYRWGLERKTAILGWEASRLGDAVGLPDNAVSK